MGARTATTYIDYQQRASEFSVGDMAYPLAGGATDEAQAGRVVAVFPAIGQVDIEFPWGSGRFPVEDVQRVTGVVAIPPSSEHTTVPGGVGTVSVPGGPVKKAVSRVAHAYMKRALYWAGKDRTYRGTKMECSGGKYTCPKCKADEEGNRPILRPVNYKRREGQSHRLLGCPKCLFLIKQKNIIGDPSYTAPVEPNPELEFEPECESTEWDQGFNSVRNINASDDLDEILAEWDETMDQGFDSVRKIKADDDADELPPRVLQVTFRGGGDGEAAKNMSELLTYIKMTADIGHSFEIVVDPDEPDYRMSFGMDGDGSDHIESVKLDGKKVEVNPKWLS